MAEATDRKALIRLAASLPKGSEERRGLLVLAKEHATEEARKKHLKEHPGADPNNHTVADKGGESGGQSEAQEDVNAAVDRVKDLLGDPFGTFPYTPSLNKLKKLIPENASPGIKSLMSTISAMGSAEFDDPEEFGTTAENVREAIAELKRELKVKGLPEVLRDIDSALDGAEENMNWSVEELEEAESVLKPPKKKTSRSLLIRLASSLPKGSEERKTILAAIPVQGGSGTRDPQDMKNWYKWWGQVNDGFGKGLAGAIASGPAKVSYRDEGTITLNYGPVFGVRYISMGIRGGGSTAPNPDYPPEFTVIVDLSSSGRMRDWPGLPISKMEQDVVEVVSNVAKKELGRLGRVKVRASRGKYWSASVSLDPNLSLAGTGSPLADVASATIQALGHHIGKAVNRVLVAYQQEYETSREERIGDLEGDVQVTQALREGLWEKADELMERVDSDPYAESEAEEARSEAYQMGVQIIRLQEQLSGITGKKYPRPEFRKQAAKASKHESVKALKQALARKGGKVSAWKEGKHTDQVVWFFEGESDKGKHARLALDELKKLGFKDPVRFRDQLRGYKGGFAHSLNPDLEAYFTKVSFNERDDGIYFKIKVFQDDWPDDGPGYSPHMASKQGGAGMKLQDRKALIRLASKLPKGSEDRRGILAGLQKFAAPTAKDVLEDAENWHEDIQDLARGISRGNHETPDMGGFSPETAAEIASFLEAAWKAMDKVIKIAEKAQNDWRRRR